MKALNYRKTIVVIILLSYFSINKGGCTAHVEENDGDHSTSEHRERASDAVHEDHNHHELSDLDRSMKELFNASCEHNIKTHECDDCRYEVGVVKAGADLFDRGLLERTKAEKRLLTKPLELNGEVMFDKARVADISSQKPGIIKKAHVAIGDQVVKGRPLVTIESPALGKAQADFLESKTMLETAERHYDRLVALEKEGISSGKELITAKNVRDSARVRRDGAFGTLVRLGMNIGAVRRLNNARVKGRLILRAPFDGTVLDMNASVGEMVSPERKLVTIADNSVVWVWADVYERDIGSFTREKAQVSVVAEVGVKAFPDKKFKGTVDFVSPSMNRTARTAAVRIIVSNPDGRLLSGMFAHVKIHMPADEKVISVPSSAVLNDENRHFVFVHHKGDYYIRREIIPGRGFTDLTEIKSGLTGRETIVAKGAFLLKSDVLRSKMGAGCAD